MADPEDPDDPDDPEEGADEDPSVQATFPVLTGNIDRTAWMEYNDWLVETSSQVWPVDDSKLPGHEDGQGNPEGSSGK